MQVARAGMIRYRNHGLPRVNNRRRADVYAESQRVGGFGRALLAGLDLRARFAQAPHDDRHGARPRPGGLDLPNPASKKIEHH
jgi:hypothetical protein